MVTKFLKRHFHPLGGHILFWNIALLVFVKLVLPNATFPLAIIIEQKSVFNSRDIITFTNNARAENNLSPLKSEYRLDAAADEKLKDMIRSDYFAHISPNGTTPWFWIKKSAYSYTVAGENLAMGFISAQDTVEAWLRSPSHRANVLGKKYTDIGVATARGEVEGVEGIIVVQMFGSPRLSYGGASPPRPSGNLPTISPIPSPTLISAFSPLPATAGTKTESEPTRDAGQKLKVTFQPVSTDKSFKPVEKPVVIDNGRIKSLNNLISWTNTVYIFYSFVLAVTSIAAFLLFNKNLSAALKTVGHINILLLGLAVPAAEVSVRAIIF